jgi:hypothetical protein
MTTVTVPQALFHYPGDQAPSLQARSPGFADDLLLEAERTIAGYGQATGRLPCALAVFALPLTARNVAIVRVRDEGGNGLAFHFLVLERKVYERFAGDPFVVAQRLPPVWDAQGTLSELAWPAEPLPPRTVADVRHVLRRVKASALREDEDPESADFERTAENSESPALLGGVQVLVDGGKLVFTRPQGDLTLMEGLWTLLPTGTRGKLWPASFAFSNDLGFDVVVLPRANETDLQGATTEEQAAMYPAGSYELALQTAAEAGNQHDLDLVFQRRNSAEVLRLALGVLAAMLLMMIASQWFVPRPTETSEPQQKAAAAAGIVAVGDPITAAAMLEFGQSLWLKR